MKEIVENVKKNKTEDEENIENKGNPWISKNQKRKAILVGAIYTSGILMTICGIYIHVSLYPDTMYPKFWIAIFGPFLWIPIAFEDVRISIAATVFNSITITILWKILDKGKAIFRALLAATMIVVWYIAGTGWIGIMSL